MVFYNTLKKNLVRVLITCWMLCLGVLTSSANVMASTSPWIDTDFSRIRIVSGQETLGEQGQVMLGLQFELEEGWKTYWRTPGDAGFPVSLTLEGSENLSSWEFFWPVPHRFTLFGLDTFGYSQEVVFPFRIKAQDPSKDVLIKGQVSYLLCQEICIPFDVEVQMRLPAGEAFPSLEESIVSQYVEQVPGLGAEVGLSIENSFLRGEGDQLTLVATGVSKSNPFISPDIIVEGPPGFSFSSPKVKLSDNSTRVEFVIPVSVAKENKGVLEGKLLTLSLIDGVRGAESEKRAQFASGINSSIPTPVEFLTILAIALLGGFILNLMPCVLPVLSLKLLSVIKHEGNDNTELRRSFLFLSLGILTSFWLLAGLAIGLKAAGVSVGWGIQFQQPLFLIAMGGIVTLFAANLFGWFEVFAPAALSDKALTVSDRKGNSGDFLKGMFATLLATPCSAPFLGTAVGFALARGTLEIFGIFTLLGLGMSIPYLLVAIRPEFARILPKPGKWMVWLKTVLGLMLLGTTVWLLSVLFVQVGLVATIVVGALLALGMAALSLKSVAMIHRIIIIGVLALFSMAVPYVLATAPQQATRSDLWQPFEPAQISKLVGEGNIVFVDVTADWCITCQVNKKLVLEKDEIQSRLGQSDVIAMLGDWTLPSEEITAYLKQYDRYGIPFNIVYGPNAPNGIVLSELLSVSEVEKAFDRAASK
ncbi:protein-disulfide reductase DsbD family protein [Kiloniella antarctica]|uniref:Protein-disulfide reductase DsbD family protein n=1 Tax=Kiloniella antarctica TaxID=1550907 RepID=A0ABW5BFY5_9PROT